MKKPRWQRRAEDRPREICTAALDVFAEKGFAAARLDEIARRAGVSKGTLYLYFKDKDDIFYALHQEGFVLLNQYLRALQNVTDPFERLKAICKAYIAFALENREFYDLMFISRSPMNALNKDDEKWEEGNRAFGALIATVTECIQRGYFKNMDPEVLSFTCWSMVHGICSLEIRGRCSVISEINQENLTGKAGSIIIEILERMHRDLKQ